MKILRWIDPNTKEFSYYYNENIVDEENNITNKFVPITFSVDFMKFNLYAENYEKALSFGFEEDPILGLFFLPGEFIPNDSYPTWEPFNTDKKLEKVTNTNIISEGKNYTLGVEIETIGGIVPFYIRNDLLISAHYDGSMRDENGQKNKGGEYVTSILKNDKGFFELKKILYELGRRCKINKTCSIHVHLGGMIFNKQFIVLAYKLGYILQNELYAMMPKSRSTGEYCRPIYLLKNKFSHNSSDKYTKEEWDKDLTKSYNEIVKIISGIGVNPGSKINKKLNHPRGRFCGYDRSSPRYWWLNFVPSLFTIEEGRKHTLEFRMHSATLNYEKVKNWILICMAFVYFIENNPRKIIESPYKSGSLKLDEIIKFSFPKKHNELNNYIKIRKEKFMNSSEVENEEYIKENNFNEKPVKIL